MKISVFGTGYVGLVTAVCLAEWGHQVIATDIDAAKIDSLKAGHATIFEPGLDDLFHRNSIQGRLEFSTDLEKAVQKSDVLIIALGTPAAGDGTADVNMILNLAQIIGHHMNGNKIVVTKSTVPVGTNDRIAQIIDAELEVQVSAHSFEIVSNPEFLRAGSAVADTLSPDRILIGATTDNAIHAMRELYAPLLKTHTPFLVMDIRSAELAKYAANAILATKISFINEFSRLCELWGSDITQVREALAADPRIGPDFLDAGIGYGGSCFPKDVQALIKMAEAQNEDLPLLRAVDQTNRNQRERFTDQILRELGSRPQKIAVWGLAFKPGTDDIRQAPAILAIPEFLAAGHSVVAFDPAAMAKASQVLRHPRLTFASGPLDALPSAEALVIFTEWPQFAGADLNEVRNSLVTPRVFDGRNLWSPALMQAKGFHYVSIGRETIRRSSRKSQAKAQMQLHHHPSPALSAPLDSNI